MSSKSKKRQPLVVRRTGGHRILDQVALVRASHGSQRAWAADTRTQKLRTVPVTRIQVPEIELKWRIGGTGRPTVVVVVLCPTVKYAVAASGESRISGP